MSKQAQARSRSKPARYLDEEDNKTPTRGRSTRTFDDRTDTKVDKNTKNTTSTRKIQKSKDQKMKDETKSPVRKSQQPKA
jgi:hypothetical protein